MLLGFLKCRMLFLIFLAGCTRSYLRRDFDAFPVGTGKVVTAADT